MHSRPTGMNQCLKVPSRGIVSLGPARMAVTLVASGLALVNATRARAEVPACYTVQQGDTAAGISQRLTGSVEYTYEPWFRILDASRSIAVPKSHYSRIQPGWRACVPSSRLRAELSHSTTAPQAAAPLQAAMPQGAAPAPAPSSKRLAEKILAIALWGMAVMALLLIAHAARQYITWRRAIVSMMQQFGERFVCEFERPLLEPGCLKSPVESRLRVIPHRKRLEILLAPAGKRRYPNLLDHRNNVKYDAERVARLLNDERLVGGHLVARGKWVVVACNFRIQAEQKGTK